MSKLQVGHTMICAKPLHGVCMLHAELASLVPNSKFIFATLKKKSECMK